MRALTICLILTFTSVSSFAWNVDFSRRAKYLKKHEAEVASPAPTPTLTPAQNLEPLSSERIVSTYSAANDIVILNTAAGFLPKSLPLRKGIRYNVHVVNVNEKEKNVSFIMGEFQQHHGTYYGQIKTFEITPQKEGIYTYQCPETSIEGKIVVLPQMEERSLATED